MLFPFLPAGEILGPGCAIRSIVLTGDPYLPDGEYTFIDTYCTDRTCDCRKTIIQIYHDKELVSIANFGWETPQYYLRWLNNPRDLEFAKEMSGPSIDYSSPDLVSRDGIMLLMKRLLDEKWVALLKEHYRLIRETGRSRKIIRLPPKPSRNAPCPCGSGKKHKNCCL
jgi:hypothetical protein